MQIILEIMSAVAFTFVLVLFVARVFASKGYDKTKLIKRAALITVGLWITIIIISIFKIFGIIIIGIILYIIRDVKKSLNK